MSHIYSTRHHNVSFYMYILTAQLHCGCSVSQTLAPPPEVLHLKSLRTETLLGSKTHLNKCPQSTKCPFWFLGKSIQSPIQCDTKKDRRRTLLFCQCLNSFALDKQSHSALNTVGLRRQVFAGGLHEVRYRDLRTLGVISE